ncbi:MAG: hypothetical protein SGBAC_008204 [Bacillariaceae sp.]
MTTEASINISSDMEGLNQDKNSLGPFFRKHEPSTSSSSPCKPHKRSDSFPTVTTAGSSSLSAESDKQASYGDKSSNLSDSIEEESGSCNDEGEKTLHTASSSDPEQPNSSHDGDAETEVEVDTDGGIFQHMFDGMSNFMTSSAAGMETAYRSQPPPMLEEGQKLHEEEKKEEHELEAVEAAPIKKDAIGISTSQEEEAMLRFDRLKDLIMMGDDEMYDDICPPNPQPVEDETTKKGYHVPENEFGSCCGRRAKRMLLCAIVALALLSALIIPLYMSNESNRKRAMALAAVATPSPTTPGPTTSPAPSTTPSISQMPSNPPSDAPSFNPTMSNMPTETPSSRPTASNIPSQIPSISQIPSLTPSKAPSISMEPSQNPSDSPSLEPSASMMPSYSTISPDYSFKVRLQWQESYFWQEEKVERWWCLECVRCAEYGGGDGNQHGCTSYSTGDEGVCRKGDSIWIRDCRERGNRFNVLENRGSGFQLRVATTNLCITRVRRRWLKVDDCDRNSMDQQFVPWEDYNKFELRPLEMEALGEREADCISQLHHPKQDELVSLHNCRLCRIYETRHWQVYLG